MALKQFVEIDEKFPTLKRARLGAAPPIEDVLDNVGSPELPTPQVAEDLTRVAEQSKNQPSGDAPRTRATTKKRQNSGKRAGQGIHKGTGTDARRYRKSGRTFPWGVRVHPDMAERVKVMAGEKNVTIGELLEEMENVYRSIDAIASSRKMSAVAALDDLLELCKSNKS